MRVEELHLKNFRCFKELDIKFPASNLAVFIGLNGSGKTAILDIIAIILNDFIEKEKPHFSNLSNFKCSFDDVYHGLLSTENKIIFSYDSKPISWLSGYNKEEIKFNTSVTDEKKFELSLKSFGEGVFFCVYYKTDKKNNIYVLGKKSSEESFKNFEKWFKEESDLENELRLEINYYSSNPRLDVIRKAMSIFLSKITAADFSKLKVRRNVRNRKIIGTYEEEITKHDNYDLYITYNKKELKISQLSEGQRLLLHIVFDIAYRLVQINFVSDGTYQIAIEGEDDFLGYRAESYTETQILQVLDTSGIVLIDEIELHLHPQWQREVLPALQKTFPNIQFIVTTHSPQVLSRVHKDDIFILNNNEIYKPSSNPIGRDANDILEEIMEVTERPKEIQKLSDKYFSLINKNVLDEAQEIRNQLIEKLDKEDPIFIRADAMITRKQLLKK